MEAEWEGQQHENEPEGQHQALDDDDDEEDILDMGDDDHQTNVKESLLMRFCPHDSSMLYPQVSIPKGVGQKTIILCDFLFSKPLIPDPFR